MTVLLVLFTLIIFLTADHFVQKARASTTQRALNPAVRRLPGDTSLAVNHTWVRRDPDGIITIGLDDFLGRLVGAVESIVLPDVGARVVPATTGIALKRGSKALALSAPLAGRVVGVNPDVLRDPSLSRTDPYGKGWLLKMKAEKGSDDSGSRYMVAKPTEWLAEQIDRAKEFFREYLGQGQLALMQDGGVPAEGLLQECDADVWKKFSESFASLTDARSN